jgi:hypothetical protein
MADGLITALAVGLVLGGIGLVIWFLASHIGTVPEGYAATTKLFDRDRRVLGPGPYLLLPGEQKSHNILVRQQQVPKNIPGIFTHGKLPVTVRLNYAMSLDLSRMNKDERYYTNEERTHQQVNTFQKHLRQLIADTPAPPPGDPMRADLTTFFSPFLNPLLGGLALELETRAGWDLAQHGIILSSNSLVIDDVEIPEEIVSAYTDLISSDFKSSARHDFIKRVRAAAPGMSDAALVQLYNAINDNPGEWHTIFTSGSLEPRLYVTEQGTIIGQAVVQEAGAPARPPAALPAAEHAADAEPAPLPSYPLTQEDMALLKTFRD